MKKEKTATIIITIIMYILSVVAVFLRIAKGCIDLETISYIFIASWWQCCIVLWIVGYIIEQVKKEITENNSK